MTAYLALFAMLLSGPVLAVVIYAWIVRSCPPRTQAECRDEAAARAALVPSRSIVVMAAKDAPAPETSA